MESVSFPRPLSVDEWFQDWFGFVVSSWTSMGSVSVPGPESVLRSV